jgi:DcuC family C4-dicarboxylate transporter
MSGTTVQLVAGLVVIGGAAYAVLRKVDVRLVLLPAALALGALAGPAKLGGVVHTFFAGFADAKTVVPICSAMGFAYVLKHTGCDGHLVRLLTGPLCRASALLIPGTVLVGFLVNIPIISQTGTAVAVGTVLLPILAATRVSPITSGAALLLGSSIGGELLNQGAPEYATVLAEAKRLGVTGLSPHRCVASTLVPVLTQLGVATLVFWALSLWADRRSRLAQPIEETPCGGETPGPERRVNLLKAVIPVLPLAFLMLTVRPFEVIPVPHRALVNLDKEVGDLRDAGARAKKADELFQGRLIGAAMVAGAAVAALSTLGTRQTWPLFLGSARAFCEGAGYAFKEVISVIVAATCFGEGVRAIGLGGHLGDLVGGSPALLLPAAGFLTMAFAFVSGSGIAATQTLFWVFAGETPADVSSLARVGSVTALGAAAGRTMSPASAVTLMCAGLTGTTPADLIKRVAIPLLAGVSAAVLLGMMMSPAAL